MKSKLILLQIRNLNFMGEEWEGKDGNKEKATGGLVLKAITEEDGEEKRRKIGLAFLDGSKPKDIAKALSAFAKTVEDIVDDERRDYLLTADIDNKRGETEPSLLGIENNIA